MGFDSRAWTLRRAAVLGLLAALAPLLAVAREAPPADDGWLAPLRLVEHVGVLVEDLTPDAERLLLTRETIQADAAERLRLASLRVHDGGPAPPVFYVQVSVLCGPGGSCATDVSSSVIQDVYLLQAAPRSFQARTWSTGRVLLVPRALVAQRVREVVREQADLLARDVIAARRGAAAAGEAGNRKGPTE